MLAVKLYTLLHRLQTIVDTMMQEYSSYEINENKSYKEGAD